MEFVLQKYYNFFFVSRVLILGAFNTGIAMTKMNLMRWEDGINDV